MLTSRYLPLPSQDVLAFGNRMSRLLNDVWGDFAAADHGTTTWVPPVDVIEEEGQIRIAAELPGVKPEDVKISVENSVLSIEGHKAQPSDLAHDRLHRFERTYGVFTRTFTLPTTVDSEGIKATYEHGVLTVILPKAEKAKARQIAVQTVTA